MGKPTQNDINTRVEKYLDRKLFTAVRRMETEMVNLKLGDKFAKAIRHGEQFLKNKNEIGSASLLRMEYPNVFAEGPHRN
ncbi:MAG: hypothetical protein CL565_06095 [Alphaproteobacteria bacterium]|nr:hypothetical protein [Alphaproteobacteria bacterium]